MCSKDISHKTEMQSRKPEINVSLNPKTLANYNTYSWPQMEVFFQYIMESEIIHAWTADTEGTWTTLINNITWMFDLQLQKQGQY